MILVSFFAIQNYNEQHTLANTSFVSEMMCMIQHPFTAVVAGPTTAAARRLLRRSRRSFGTAASRR